MAYATYEEFAARHGANPNDQDTIEAILDDATALIASEVDGSEETWVDESSTAPDAVKAVTITVAYRAYSNPDALAQREVGDVRAWWRGEEIDALYLTSRDKRTVRKAAARSSFQSTPLVSPFSGDDE